MWSPLKITDKNESVMENQEKNQDQESVWNDENSLKKMKAIWESSENYKNDEGAKANADNDNIHRNSPTGNWEINQNARQSPTTSHYLQPPMSEVCDEINTDGFLNGNTVNNTSGAAVGRILYLYSNGEGQGQTATMGQGLSARSLGRPSNNNKLVMEEFAQKYNYRMVPRITVPRSKSKGKYFCKFAD